MKKTVSFMLILFLAIFLTQCGKKSTTKKKRKPSAKVIAQVTDGRVVVDGDNKEWENTGFLSKEIGSGNDRGKFPPKIDIKSVKAVRDSDNLYLLLEAKPVNGGIACIYVDSDGSSATGISDIMLGKKGKFPRMPQGWDYVIKLTYSSYADGNSSKPMLIFQVEKFFKVEYGHMSKLTMSHKNNKDNPSYAGARGILQELRIPLEALNIGPPTGIAFLFVEGIGNVFTEYDKHCKLIKAVCK